MNYTIYEQLLLIVTLITVALQCFVIWMVQNKTPSNMKDYRYYLNNFTSWDMLFTIILGIIFQPFPTTPIFASSVRGLALYGGIEFSRIMAASAVYGGSTVICAQDLALMYRWAIIYPDRRVHNFFVSKYFKIPWTIFYQTISISLAVAFYLCFIPEAELPAYLATQKPITVPLIPNEVIICMDLTATKSRLFVVTLVALFGISETLCFTFIYLILKILREHKIKFSAATRKLHFQFLFLLTAQLLTPVVLIILPVTLDLLLVIAGGYIPTTFAVEIGYLAITFYGFTNASFCIWFVGPYRMFVYEKFVLPWLTPIRNILKLESSSAVGHISTLNAPSTIAQLDPRSSLMF
ncbi:hypothetical protein M3Y98_00999200 [Aphelenchoides besseyi]|nr:hypothetical protein M3Y98_00999200 [Aphelenchoides besseyi]KAI6195138.1 hypothetical protein M3Y96_01199100 [Aphelenchoides besseyi]